MAGERSSLTQIDDDRCDMLRWKGMFIEAEWAIPFRTPVIVCSGATRPSSASGPTAGSWTITNAIPLVTAINPFS